MTERRIDEIARALASGFPRRRLLRGVVAGLGIPLLGGPLAAEPARAACKKVGRRCDRNNDCCDHAACTNDECTCRTGFRDCNGECVDLDKDEQHCGRCDKQCRRAETCCDGECADVQTDADHCGGCGRRCARSESCVAGVCTTADGCPLGVDFCATGTDLDCRGVAGCVCSLSTEGATLCGQFITPGAVCGQCESSADCAAIGDGAFCVEATGGPGACCRDQGNVCRLPCPV